MSLLVMNQNPKFFTKIQATLKKLMKSNLTHKLCKKCLIDSTQNPDQTRSIS